MPQAVYILCALTSLGCAILLGRAWHATRVKLLFWSLLCFSALTITNALLFLDLVVIPTTDLQPLRSMITLLGITALLYGLISGEK